MIKFTSLIESVTSKLNWSNLFVSCLLDNPLKCLGASHNDAIWASINIHFTPPHKTY